jgi:hypothetical protein
MRTGASFDKGRVINPTLFPAGVLRECPAISILKVPLQAATSTSSVSGLRCPQRGRRDANTTPCMLPCGSASRATRNLNPQSATPGGHFDRLSVRFEMPAAGTTGREYHTMHAPLRECFASAPRSRHPRHHSRRPLRQAQCPV